VTILGWAGLAFAAVTGYGVYSFNRLVRLRNQALAAWSDVEVQLKRRHDLLPKLVEAVRRHAAYERSVLEEVTRLRAETAGARGGPERKAVPEGRLGEAVQRLLALAEAYPELRADRGFVRLQREISEVENDLQHARRFYNGAVRLLNTRIDSFPDLLLARVFRFRPMAYFQLEGDG